MEILKNMDKLLKREIDTLIDYLDEHIDLFCKRIDYMGSGERSKVKFIDEKILPNIDKKIKEQNEKVIELLSKKTV